MTVIELTHGGSGTGQSYWQQWSSGCLVSLDMKEHDTRIRQCERAPTIGTMGHTYIERFFTLGTTEKVKFVDTVCERQPEQDWQDLAYRVVMAWLRAGHHERWSEVISCEQLFKGPHIDAHIGVPFTARTDFIGRNKYDGALEVVDWKFTMAARKDDEYLFREVKCYLQKVLYPECFFAETGIMPDRFVVQQLVCVKAPHFPVWDLGIHDQKKFQSIRRWLQFCNARKETYPREYLLDKCGFCSYQRTCPKEDFVDE